MQTVSVRFGAVFMVRLLKRLIQFHLECIHSTDLLHQIVILGNFSENIAKCGPTKYAKTNTARSFRQRLVEHLRFVLCKGKAPKPMLDVLIGVHGASAGNVVEPLTCSKRGKPSSSQDGRKPYRQLRPGPAHPR